MAGFTPARSLPDVIDSTLPDWHISLAKFRKVFCFGYCPELEGAL